MNLILNEFVFFKFIHLQKSTNVFIKNKILISNDKIPLKTNSFIIAFFWQSDSGWKDFW